MTIYREVKRSLRTREFKICFLAYLVFYIYLNLRFFGRRTLLTERNLYDQLFFLSIRNSDLMSSFYFILPLICGVVGSDILGQDIRSSYYTSVIHREGKRKFIRNRAVTSFITGGLFVISIFILDIIIKAMIYPAIPPSYIFGDTFDSVSFISSLWVYHINIYVILAVVLSFCYGGMFALVGFVLSLFIRNKFIIKSFSFVLAFILWNIVSIFSIGTTIPTLIRFGGNMVVHTPIEIIMGFLIPVLVCILIINLRGDGYEYF